MWTTYHIASGINAAANAPRTTAKQPQKRSSPHTYDAKKQHRNENSGGILPCLRPAGPAYLLELIANVAQVLAKALKNVGLLFFSHTIIAFQLLGFAMQRVLVAERAILIAFKPVGGVFLVFERVVIALLAFRAREGDLYSHV